jgi:hypothetical protein
MLAVAHRHAFGSSLVAGFVALGVLCALWH